MDLASRDSKPSLCRCLACWVCVTGFPSPNTGLRWGLSPETLTHSAGVPLYVSLREGVFHQKQKQIKAPEGDISFSQYPELRLHIIPGSLSPR